MEKKEKLIAQISDKNEQIINFLFDYSYDDFSIFGLLGRNLTLINYGLKENNEIFIDKALHNIERMQPSLTAKLSNLSIYSDGLVSFGVLLDYIEKHQVADFDQTIFKITGFSAYQSGKYMLQKNNLDFIAGATGIGFYYSHRMDKCEYSHKYLTEWVSKTFELTKNGIKIYDVHLSSKSENIINLGLAHGLTSVLKLALKLNKITVVR